MIRDCWVDPYAALAVEHLTLSFSNSAKYPPLIVSESAKYRADG